MKKNKSSRGISLGLIGLLVSSSAWAMSVNPGRTEIRLAPGATLKTQLTVVNNEADVLQVEVTTKDWFVLEANKGIGVKDWIRVGGRKAFKLKPGQSREIPLKILCPENAQGELVGMVSFASQPKQGSMVTSMISVSVYVAVDGREKASGEISDLQARVLNGLLWVGAYVKSTGNIHLRPAGTLTVTRATGESVGVFSVPQGDPVYPGTQRLFPGVGVETKPVPGDYSMTAQLRSGSLEFVSTRTFTVTADGQVQMKLAADASGKKD